MDKTFPRTKADILVCDLLSMNISPPGMICMPESFDPSKPQTQENAPFLMARTSTRTTDTGPGSWIPLDVNLCPISIDHMARNVPASVVPLAYVSSMVAMNTRGNVDRNLIEEAIKQKDNSGFFPTDLILKDAMKPEPHYFIDDKHADRFMARRLLVLGIQSKANSKDATESSLDDAILPATIGGTPGPRS